MHQKSNAYGIVAIGIVNDEQGPLRQTVRHSRKRLRRTESMRALTLVLCGVGSVLALGSGRGACQALYDPYAIAEPPPPGPDDASITLIDENGKQRAFDADDLADLPRRKVELRDKESVKSYEGVSLVDALERFGVGFGDALRGKRAATIALCDARDDYRVVISLLEIDPATGDELVLLADRCDGQPLGASEGPFRLVIPGDKRQIRSIRMLRMIRIANLSEMRLP